MLVNNVGWLTTHVLDTAQGCPAANMALQLWRIDPVDGRIFLKSVYTTRDGRTEEPLLVGSAMTMGIYEILFGVGPYFAQQSLELPTPPFLDEVPIRFGIADVDTHYHVPLLVSPWAYSTYRGS